MSKEKSEKIESASFQNGRLQALNDISAKLNSFGGVIGAIAGAIESAIETLDKVVG